MNLNRKLSFHYLLLIAMLLFSWSCSSDDERELSFVGDSLVARWDLRYWFPTRVTHNDGVSGSGIAHIEECAGRYAGRDVVVIVGTNDLGLVATGDEEAYVTRYVQAIEALQGRRTFLFSIFPKSRQWCSNPEQGNKNIRRLNTAIKAAVRGKAITYVDVFDLLEKDGFINMQYSYDGLHLSQEGYELITKQLNKEL